MLIARPVIATLVSTERLQDSTIHLLELSLLETFVEISSADMKKTPSAANLKNAKVWWAKRLVKRREEEIEVEIAPSKALDPGICWPNLRWPLEAALRPTRLKEKQRQLREEVIPGQLFSNVNVCWGRCLLLHNSFLGSAISNEEEEDSRRTQHTSLSTSSRSRRLSSSNP